MPRPNAGLLGRLLGGTPIQYMMIDHDDIATATWSLPTCRSPSPEARRW